MSNQAENTTESGGQVHPLVMPHVKGGRCWNGSHRDRGQVVHAVPPARCQGDHFDDALCGAAPGRTSYGWTESNQPINCPKCLKRLV